MESQPSLSEQPQVLPADIGEFSNATGSINCTESLFPSDFNLESTEELLNKKVSSSNELKKAVKYVQDCRNEAISKNLEYFMIDLKDFTSLIRTTIMCEVLEKFKYVGTPSKDVSYQLLASLITITNNPSKTYDRPILPVSTIDPDNCEYIIAMTKNFGERMGKLVLETPVKK